jgi:hypothetical protein
VARRHAAPARRRGIAGAPSTVDLHTHTHHSDGLLAPAALVADAAACGVRLLAITDHDSLAAYRELQANGAVDLPEALELVPGVEINAVNRGEAALTEGELHILGYGVDPDDEAFEAVLARQREARRVRFTRTVERLRELDLPIDDAVGRLDLTRDDALGRPTIARALMDHGFAESVEDAFSRLLGHGGPAYVPRDGVGPLEAIGVIRAAGGLPVLAHFAEAPTRRGVLAELRDAGLRGLEVHHRSFDDETAAAVGAVATELGLVATGGTDYHGDLGPYADAHAELRVPADVGATVRRVLGVPSSSA